MGVNNRSSSKKTKNNSSSKSKRSRIPSQRKKTRKDKSRNTYSDSDDDSSRRRSLSISSSSSSSSSSTSNDEIRRTSTRPRLRSRSKVRHEKKRSRRISSSPSSSEDSHPVKRRKKSRRKDSDTKNKQRKMMKKKKKRHSSLSSSSSDDYGGKRRSRIKDDHEKKPRSRSRSRSRSVSSYSAYSISSSEKNIIPSTRLKSVITIGNTSFEEEENKDGGAPNEEMVYDHDDYPSCKSNDSNEGCKKDMDSSSNFVGEGEALLPLDEDLESLLRKKALENLRKRVINSKPKTSTNLEQEETTPPVVDSIAEAAAMKNQESGNLDANKSEAHNSKEVIDGPSSTSMIPCSNPPPPTASQEHNSKEEKKDHHDDDKEEEASQFVQKTINRMVNGEMVQVSYTVRKPQPRALARRQLRR